MNNSTSHQVQWSFLQYKKQTSGSISTSSEPAECFLHTATQIGSKILIYGGCDYYGEAKSQLLLYDTATFLWSAPTNSSDFQEDHPGKLYVFFSSHLFCAQAVDMDTPRRLWRW